VKSVYQYADDHLRSRFPTLPSYQKFNERLNRLNGALVAIAQHTRQCAVRAASGLYKHVFGALVAAFFLLDF